MRFVSYCGMLHVARINNGSRVIRAALPRFQLGIVDVNFERLISFLDAIGCREMPVGLSADGTNLHPGLRPYKDSCGSDGSPSWKLAGAHAEIPEFKDYDELARLVSKYEHNLAEKVRHRCARLMGSTDRPSAGSSMAYRAGHSRPPTLSSRYHADQVHYDSRGAAEVA